MISMILAKKKAFKSFYSLISFLLTIDASHIRFSNAISWLLFFWQKKDREQDFTSFLLFFFFCSQFLEEAGLYESEEENTKRKEVLLEIERVTSCFHFF
jgi:hypothetical protein